MNLRRGLMAQMASGKIPAFMNRLESGSFSVSSGYETKIALSNIDLPKGFLIYSNEFDLFSAKADKPMLGAYAAMCILGTNTLVLLDNVYYLQTISMYAVNWGQNTGSKNPTWRNSRTEDRGIRYFRPSNKTFHVRGFGDGEYDFKFGVTYNWIAWD